MTGTTIIVEGLDKCGKTSLCEDIARVYRHSLPILKFNQPKGDAMAEYAQALVDNPDPFIADRFHMGESVYGPVYRGTQPVVDSRLHALEGDLAHRSALVVYMTDSASNICKRFEEHAETFAHPDHVRELLWRYEAEFLRCTLPKIRLVWQPKRRIEMAMTIANLADWAFLARPR